MSNAEFTMGPLGGVNDLLREPEQVKACSADLVQRFRRDEGHQIIPGLDLSSEQHVTLDINLTGNSIGDESLQRIEQGFLQAMIEYESTVKEKYKTGIVCDHSELHTMEQVWEKVDEAVERYESKGKVGPWAHVRRAFRKLGENGEAVQGWLGLLPAENNYLSVICGGIKMIITAAIRMRKVADEVITALGDIPDILSGAQRVLKVFEGRSTKLVSLSSALYASILEALGVMLHYLHKSISSRKEIVKMMAAVFQGASFQAPLTEKIKKITICRDKFSAEADICHKEVTKNMHDMEQAKMGSIYAKLLFLESEQCRAQEEQRRNHDELVKRMSHSEKLSMLVTQGFLSNPAANEYSWEIRIRLNRCDTDNPTSPIYRRASTMISFVALNDNKETPRERRKRLLSQLDYDKDCGATDLTTNYGLVARLSPEDQNRSIHVIKSEKLRDWVATEKSSALVVHGNDGAARTQSAMSFVCARIVYVLEDTLEKNRELDEMYTPLYFFCGEHCHSDHSWETPSGIANSLLAQLLRRRRNLKLDKLNTQKSFDNKDVKKTLKRFEAVVAALPSSSVIICIIDALSFYVDDSRASEDAEVLIKRLLKLAYSTSRKRPRFKLLLTAPNRLRSEEIDNTDESDVIEVPKVISKFGGFTATEWELSVGTQFNRMMV